MMCSCWGGLSQVGMSSVQFNISFFHVSADSGVERALTQSSLSVSSAQYGLFMSR